MVDTEDEERPKSKFTLAAKEKCPTFWENLKYYFLEYMSSSSLHGFKYVGDRKRSIIERIFWIIIIATSYYFGVILIIDTYDKWNNSPVIVSFGQNPASIGAIPFPAITICSETKAKQTILNFTQLYHVHLDGGNFSQEEQDYFEDVSLLCDSYLYDGGRVTTDPNVVEYFQKVAPSLQEMLWMCRWLELNETCETLFTPTLTEDGICFTFNMLDKDDIYTYEVFNSEDLMKVDRDSEDWSLERGYSTNSDLDTYPRRTMISGLSHQSFNILLKSFPMDQDFICRGPFQGFKIILHSPDEIPRTTSHFFRAPLNQEILVAIKPVMITTSTRLRKYDPKRRSCYFAEERKLRYFKKYTQRNCDIECSRNITYELCGCVSFHMPHSESTPICGSGSIKCIRDAQVRLVSDKANNFNTCDCLPSCTSLSYDIEISQSEFNWKKVIQTYRVELDEFSGIQTTRLKFAFKEMQFIPSEKSELFVITDLLANCGGLLALFFGFSVISFVETIYFLTLRLLINIVRHGRHYWSASEDLLKNMSKNNPYVYKDEDDKPNPSTSIKID